MEDGLGAAHREEDPLGCDGSARDSARVSVNNRFARTCRDDRRESMVN